VFVERFPSIRQSYVGVLLTERSWVVHCTVFLTLWAFAIMAVKLVKLAGQQTALTYDLLPADPTTKIHPGNIDLVLGHIRQLPVNPARSFLVKRVLLALHHFKSRQSVQEICSVLSSQAETDAAMVNSSFTMLKVLIWGIPILGFIGTVVGISEAVAGFTQSVQAADNLDVVKAALGDVTKGLAVAFDTTLIGLVLSIAVMFPTNSLQKAEDDLLSAIDGYANEKLLPRLSAPAETLAGTPGREAAVKAPQAALEEWQTRLENLETALFERVLDALAEIRQEVHKKVHVPDDL
jgi:biopolymer transport protein ExbB/TolQ